MTSRSVEEPDDLLRVLRGELSPTNTLSGGWLRAVQLYLNSLDGQSPDWYSGLEGAWGAEGDVVVKVVRDSCKLGEE